jgi:flagellar biosynthesis protein
MAPQKQPQREKAIALKYCDRESAAPRLVAKGEGYVAARIKEVARANGIPLKRDDDLVELLAQVELDREIPRELFAAVAEILAWIFRANTLIEKEIPEK